MDGYKAGTAALPHWVLQHLKYLLVIVMTARSDSIQGDKKQPVLHPPLQKQHPQLEGL